MEFHRWFCSRHRAVLSCRRPFTSRDYLIEKNKFRTELEEEFRTKREEQIPRPQRLKRQIDDDEDADEEYEYFMWKKHIKRKWKEGDTIIHNHYHMEQPQQTYYQPTYQYPSYGQYYPRYYYPRYYPYGYGGYGSGYGYPRYGYGGYPSYGGGYGGGQAFNFGLGSGLGIMTPGFGFGLGSFLNIGVG
ncbi:unnamed protein product, partial [Mesorhabditis spiculigera]